MMKKMRMRLAIFMYEKIFMVNFVVFRRFEW